MSGPEENSGQRMPNGLGKSLSDAERNQIDLRMQQLLDENPTLSPATLGRLELKTEPPSVPFEVLDEYFFLREVVG